MNTDLLPLVNQVHRMEALALLRSLPDNSVDILFTDPPYNLPGLTAKSVVTNPGDWGVDKCAGGFTEEKGLKSLPRYKKGLGPAKAYQAWTEEWAIEAYRVLKPGGMILVFSSTSLYHRAASGIEDAGFETRDMWAYAYAKGMPTGQRELSKDIAKQDGALAELWRGWKNIVKPAFEPIYVGRKELDGNVGSNASKWGCIGGFNVGGTLLDGARQISNIILLVNGLFDSYSRFFFTKKATKDDRNLEDCWVFKEDAPTHVVSWMTRHFGRDFFFGEERLMTNPEFLEQLENDHPTVKEAVACQEILTRVARPGALVVDCFCGSGSIPVAALRHGCDYIASDLDRKSVLITKARLYLESRK